MCDSGTGLTKGGDDDTFIGWGREGAAKSNQIHPKFKPTLNPHINIQGEGSISVFPTCPWYSLSSDNHLQLARAWTWAFTFALHPGSVNVNARGVISEGWRSPPGTKAPQRVRNATPSAWFFRSPQSWRRVFSPCEMKSHQGEWWSNAGFQHFVLS